MVSDLVKSDALIERSPLVKVATTPAPNYEQAEQSLCQLMAIADLDQQIAHYPELKTAVETAIATAIPAAYGEADSSEAAHLFLQRVLYRINRLKLFWYDDLRAYENERSFYLQAIRNQIESAWQDWELAQLGIGSLNGLGVEKALRARAAADLNPEPSETGIYFRDRMTVAGYRRLLEIASLDGLVEASQLSRTVGGVANEIQAVMTQLLVEEYGAGKLRRKHSTYFCQMLEELGMETQPEAYLNQVPWEVLATINHSFLLSERKRYYLRYVGGLLYTEISVPAGFSLYQAAAERLGLPEAALSYWKLHIKVDQLHGRWMLDGVALPLIAHYPDDAWEMVLGYDQQRFMSDRAGVATAQAAQRADQG